MLQAVIPASLVQEVMQDAHGLKFAGHPGAEKMQTKLKRHVTWPSIAKDIGEFVTVKFVISYDSQFLAIKRLFSPLLLKMSSITSSVTY